jgi:hypothetical protein
MTVGELKGSFRYSRGQDESTGGALIIPAFLHVKGWGLPGWLGLGQRGH